MTWNRKLVVSFISCALLSACYQTPQKDEDTDGATDGATDPSSASETQTGIDSQSGTDTSPSGPSSESDSESDSSSSEPTSGPTGSESDSNTTSGPTTDTNPTGDTDSETTGPAAACMDGNADPGELCLDVDSESLQVGRNPRYAAIGDVDIDGEPDIITANWVNTGDGSISVLESDGVGGFAPADDTTAIGGLEVVHVTDGDSDGDDDIVVFGYGAQVFTNLDGTYLSSWQSQNIGAPYENGLGELLVVDLDGNDYLDILSNEAYGYAYSHGAYQSSNWQFPSGPDGSLPVPGEGASGMIATVFDFDDDTIVDAVALNQYSSSGALVHGDGAGGFVSNDETVQLCQGQFSGVRHGAAGDVDGDGTIDLLATCMGGDFSLVLGDGAGGFSEPAITSLDGAFRPQLHDIDNDGDLDVFVSSSSINRVVLYLNDGSGGLELSELEFSVEGAVRGFAVADINGDDALDLVVPYDDGNLGFVALFVATP